MRRGESGLSFLLAVDKPSGPTSHDVVDRVRRALGERRVGHAGTLDPDASGVMVIGIGAATRLLSYLSADRKSYIARIDFGAETTTDDAVGEVTVSMAIPEGVADVDFATRALAGLVGAHDQVPPAYSAAHVGGRRAYAVARSGQMPTLAPRRVEVFASTLVAIDAPDDDAIGWVCAFEVSKGTYIRSIARDLGRSLGTAAHLGNLRRTASGGVSVAQCVTPDELDRLGSDAAGSRALDPLGALGIARRELSQAELVDVGHGRRIPCGLVGDAAALREPAEGERVGVVFGGRMYGVWECRRGDLSCVCNLPGGVGGVRQTPL